MKRFGILSLLFFVSILHSVKAEAQVYAKLNGLYALVGVINPAVEFRLTDHSAFQTEFVYSPWQSINVDGASKPMHFGIFLNEYRYYFRGYARGWYVGGNVGMMAFRMSKPYVENWGIHLENRYSKGYGFMFGACAGYERIFRERWVFDVFFGWSWMTSFYNGYDLDGKTQMEPRCTPIRSTVRRSGIPTRSASRSASAFTIRSSTKSAAKRAGSTKPQPAAARRVNGTRHTGRMSFFAFIPQKRVKMTAPI